MEESETVDEVKCVTTNGGRRSFSSWIRVNLCSSTTILIAFFILALFMNGGIKPFTQRGFFCNDTSIRYPRKTDTIGLMTLLFFALVLPAILIKICDESFNNIIENTSSIARRRRKSGDCLNIPLEEETLIPGSHGSRRRKQLSSPMATDQLDQDLTELRLPDDQASEADEVELFTRVPLDSDTDQSDISERSPKEHRTKACTMFFFGLSVTIFLAGLGKMTSGRLRPHFMQVCDPDIDCNASENINKYIETFSCKKIPLDSRSYYYITTSWPSGHAAIIFYSMLFLAIYLQNIGPTLTQRTFRRFKKLCDPILLYTSFMMMFSFAGYISMTRISDYHHHPLDVVSGALLGCIVAIGVTRSIVKYQLPPQYLASR